jgi:fluoroquinolone resistance protein
MSVKGSQRRPAKVLEDETLTTANLLERSADILEFVRCTFIACDLQGPWCAGRTFVECTFRDCDLSLADLDRTALQEVTYERCKLVGARFDRCHTFLLSVSFAQCILDLASFHGLKLKGTRFLGCRMRESDLSDADLSNASFAESDLGAALFDGTVLEGADLRSAVHYSIDPTRNRLRKARFSAEGLSGLLDRTGIIIEV